MYRNRQFGMLVVSTEIGFFPQVGVKIKTCLKPQLPRKWYKTKPNIFVGLYFVHQTVVSQPVIFWLHQSPFSIHHHTHPVSRFCTNNPHLRERFHSEVVISVQLASTQRRSRNVHDANPPGGEDGLPGRSVQWLGSVPYEKKP